MGVRGNKPNIASLNVMTRPSLPIWVLLHCLNQPLGTGLRESCFSFLLVKQNTVTRERFIPLNHIFLFYWKSTLCWPQREFSPGTNITLQGKKNPLHAKSQPKPLCFCCFCANNRFSLFLCVSKNEIECRNTHCVQALVNYRYRYRFCLKIVNQRQTVWNKWYNFPAYLIPFMMWEFFFF